MEVSSYDELLQQVESLKAENCNLRKELADNSNHLSKLENEASTMKEVLSHLQVTMDGRPESVISKCEPAGIANNRNLTMRDACEGNLQNGNVQSQLLQLQRERNRILQDIEAEEKERQWFLTCLGKINRQLGQLSSSNGFSHQNDHPLRQQLENDAESIREAMQQKLGTRGEMLRREEARFRSICLIEKEMERLFPEQEQQENSVKLFNGRLDHDVGDDKISDSDVQNDLSKSRSSDDEMFSKMTTSATQTVGMFSSESISPPPPPGGDLGSLASIYHGTWPVDKVLWHSGPSSLGSTNSIHSFHNQDTGSVASFRSNMGANSSYRNRSHNQQLGTKVEMVYSLLSMLGSHDKDDMSRKLLNMSSSVDSCIAMRQSGCLPLLIELIHGDDKDGSSEKRRPSRDTRRRASQALHNIIHSHPDDKRGRREARVLRLLEQIRDYCSFLRDSDSGSDEEQASPEAASADQHPVPAMAMLMKLSFDEEHRHAMCQLGGLQTIAELLQVDYDTHSNMNDQYCITLRRYAGMALTNLTFGDGTNKALLCSMRPFMRALVAQLHSPSEDLRQVIASVLRNLSWRADQASKKTLREVGAVATLMKASMEAKKESTMKSILSALWNLSAHCSMNKADICAVDGALAFLVGTLTFKSPSKTHAIIENGGGILRNISSHIAVREDYRAILRKHNCLQILLQHLRSPSLTIVSNACGTLWNLSARCPEDQQTLWDMGAVGMLRNLVHSKHKMISMGSSAALKNLLSSKPGGLAATADKHKSGAPSLLVRKQKFLEAELDQNLSETCENLDSPKTSPTHHRSDGEPKYGNVRNNYSQASTKSCTPVLMPYQLHGRMYHSVGGQLPPKHVSRSDSKESIISTRSDSSHDRLRNLNLLLHHRQTQGLSQENSDFTDEDLNAPPGVLESRLQYVMQEVTKQIAIENNEMIKSDCGSRGNSYLKSSSQSQRQLLPETKISSKSAQPIHTQNDNCDKTVSSSRNPIFDKYSNLSSMIENLNLDDNESTDQPVNYSLKYSEEASLCLENSKLDKDSETRLPSKVDNRISDDHHKDLNRNDLGQNYNKCVKQTNVEWQSSLNQVQATFKLNANQALYSHYAETDLDDPDQPTNYSLRYTEDTDTTDNFCPPAPKDEKPYFTREYTAKGPSIHDDTMMTYCTEDTPLNFSTATSMTDLRDIKEMNSCCTDELQEEKCSDTIMKRVNGNDDLNDTNNDSKTSENYSVLAEKGSDVCDKSMSQGTASPDKAVTYCVEGTPVCFSRVSSLSSIHSNDIGDNCYEVSQPLDSSLPPANLLQEVPSKSSSPSINQTHFHSGQKSNEEDKNNALCIDDHDIGAKGVDDKTRPCIVSTKSDGRTSNTVHEGKTVTFGEDHYAEETPLMFSRCSSLGSLSSFDQHSIHDDHSSIISDFSRRASEVVSPSDLPDSPGQTRSPSPHSLHAPVSFTSKAITVNSVTPKAVKAVPPSKASETVKAKASIFEDSSHQFAEEGTPLQFSQATSLSSLQSCFATADRETTEVPHTETTNGDGDNSLYSDEKQSSPDSPEYEKNGKHSPEGDSQDDEQEKEVISADTSECEDDSEVMLEECINSAMPNNARHSKYKHNNTKLYSRINVLGNASARMLRSSGIPVKASNLRVGYANASLQTSNNTAMTGSGGAAMASCKSINQPHEHHCQASQDKLDNYTCKTSELHSGLDSNSDTSSVFDDDNDKMLAQCIQSGMPKSSPSSMINSSAKHANSFPDHKNDVGIKQHYHKTHFCHVHADTSAKTTEQKPLKRYQMPSCNRDAVTTFEVEGTPVNFSTATSLSDLTIDSVSADLVGVSTETYEQVQCKKMSASKNRPCSPSYASSVSAKQNNNLTVIPPNKNLQSSYSQKDSKISKTCDIEAKGKVNLGATAQPSLKCCNLPTKKSDLILENFPEKPREPNFEDDATVSCVVDDASAVGETEKNTYELQHSQDHHMRYQVEDTPVCFSRNSSLSSLSVESLGVEPTPLEQALLDECINSGMPKGRPPPNGNSERKPGKARSSKLPCPVSSKDRQLALGRGSLKMDSIQETGISEVDGKTQGIEQVEKIVGNESQSLSQPKNLESAAVAACGTGTAADDTKKADMSIPDTDAKVIEANSFACERFVSEKPELADMEQIDSNADLSSQIECHAEYSNIVEKHPVQNGALTGALLLEMEAARVAVEVQNIANRLPEELEHSMISQSSDLIESVNPPSVMGEVLSGSMLSSCASETFSGIRSCGRRGSSELKCSPEQLQSSKGHGVPRARNVPELVMRALADGTAVTKPPSISGSLENLSMRSSMVGDLIDQVKPPSVMEDIDMTSSTYSVCSIVSEVADSKSEGLSADGSLNSDIIFKCLKPVVAMAELYARDGNMVASNRSNFSVSDIIENVNPPSTFLEITDTINDCTEVETDTMEVNNDTDVEDDLPADPEPLRIGTLNHEKDMRNKEYEQRTAKDNLPDKKFVQRNGLVSNVRDVEENEEELDITPEEVLVLREDANLVLSTLNEIQFCDLAGEEPLSEDMLIECETLSLVSNESDSSHSTSGTPDLSGTPQGSPIIQRGPRIVKPLNRDAFKQHLQTKDEEKNGPKPIRGRRKVLFPRQQTISSFASTRFSSPKPKEMAVKPTRTSALRANQSQQKVSTTGEIGGNGGVGSKRLPPKSSSPLNSSGEIKVTRPLAPSGRGLQRGRTEVLEKNRNNSNNKVSKVPNLDSEEEVRPNPPIKQGTFTKDKPSQNSPPKISPTKTRIPTFGGMSPVEGAKMPSQAKDDLPPCIGIAPSVPVKGDSSKILDGGGAPCSPKPLRVQSTTNQLTNKGQSRKSQNSSIAPKNIQGVASLKTTAIRNSPSSHSLSGQSNGSPTKRGPSLTAKVSGLNGSLNATKRSTSNVSLCSNTSSSTSNSRKSVSGNANKKETQSKIASLWKSSSKTYQKHSLDKEPTPKEGLSRSSTYEKLPRFGSPNMPRHDVDADMDAVHDASLTSLPSSAPSSPVQKPLTKESMKVLAEARLQKWAARKARILARKAEDLEAAKEVSETEMKNSSMSPNTIKSDSVESHSRLDGSPVSDGDTSVVTENEDVATCPETSEIQDQQLLPNQVTINNNNNNGSSEIKGPASAIVPPFNYTPNNQFSSSTARSGTKSHSRSLIPTLNHVVVSPSLRQRENCVRNVESEKIADGKQPCLVTTV